MKKIKIPFETKVAVVAFLIMCVICAIAVGVNFFVYGGVAHAEGEEIAAPEATEPQVVVVEKEVEKDDLATVFKENILPHVSGVASAFLMGLIVLFPLIKVIGKNKTLLGMLSVTRKTLEALQAKDGELTVDNIVARVQENVVDALKEFIIEGIQAAVKANVKDTTGDITKLQSNVDVLSAQLTNLISAAVLVWGEADGVKPLLLNSPTSATLAGYLAEVKELKAQVAEQNAEAIAPVEALEKELEVYSDENK